MRSQIAVECVDMYVHTAPTLYYSVRFFNVIVVHTNSSMYVKFYGSTDTVVVKTIRKVGIDQRPERKFLRIFSRFAADVCVPFFQYYLYKVRCPMSYL